MAPKKSASKKRPAPPTTNTEEEEVPQYAYITFSDDETDAPTNTPQSSKRSRTESRNLSLPENFRVCRSIDFESLQQLGAELRNLFSSMNWLPLVDGPRKIYRGYVEEFYQNLEDTSDGTSISIRSSVKGVPIEIDGVEFNTLLGIPSTANVPVYEGSWVESRRFPKKAILTMFFGRDIPSEQCESLSRANMDSPLHCLLHYVVSTNINPRKGGSISRVTIQDLSIMYSIVTGVQAHLGAFCLKRLRDDKRLCLYPDVLSRYFDTILSDFSGTRVYSITDEISARTLSFMNFVRIGESWSRKPKETSSAGPSVPAPDSSGNAFVQEVMKKLTPETLQPLVDTLAPLLVKTMAPQLLNYLAPALRRDLGQDSPPSRGYSPEPATEAAELPKEGVPPEVPSSSTVPPNPSNPPS